ncbi:MAG: hypothetical protein CMJ64_22710 [Planctomycetaceae bacterium]|nr:hypothetical protein [Planctomycetaceae bacterium]
MLRTTTPRLPARPILIAAIRVGNLERNRGQGRGGLQFMLTCVTDDSTPKAPRFKLKANEKHLSVSSSIWILN